MVAHSEWMRTTIIPSSSLLPLGGGGGFDCDLVLTNYRNSRGSVCVFQHLQLNDPRTPQRGYENVSGVGGNLRKT